MGFIEILNTYGSLIVSITSLVYLIAVKFNHIDAIAKTLEKMDATIESKLDIIATRQLEHEGRISKLEGKMNGRH
jgi:hypothetical protein